MYKLCQLSAVFSSCFLGRTLDKKSQTFFLLPTQFGHCINAKKNDFDHGRRRRTSMIPLENDLQSTAFSPKLQTRNWPSAFDRGSLRQRQPTTINDAAATTLELQSHLSLANTASRPSDIPVDVVHQGRPTQPNGTTRLREQLVSRMEKLRTDPSHSCQL